MDYYVVVRTDQGGGFLAISGLDNSYTRDLRKVQVFKSHADAQAVCSENEQPIALCNVMHGWPH